ncbi:glycerol-3-phosphate dehydrogenase, partial [Bacillus vallismortis]|nr:glycerol-3-phosphate dehydrogenase [Bacillus vallismortis]
EKYDVKIPSTEALHQVLINGQKVETAVESLMARGKTHEMEYLVNTFENQAK